ncbi:MAG: hypothetical protein IPM47_11545 [Sphingobacteriales bacterium]|nr:MAG: hypothetical protein IPM47_11545 [Sphingobacteriales bacterium]
MYIVKAKIGCLKTSLPKGKTSTGWFFGLKLHLVINQFGEIVKFAFTAGNVADNNHNLLRYLLGNLQGKCASRQRLLHQTL